LKINTSPLLSLLICLLFLQVKGQNISLTIKGSDSTQTKIINTLNYQKTFKDFQSLKLETNTIIKQLQEIGYIELNHQKLTKVSSKEFVLEVDLKQKYDTIYIYDYHPYFKTEDLESISDTIHDTYFVIPISKTAYVLDFLNSLLANKGTPFATLQLKDIEKQNERNLKASLSPSIDTKRTIDKIVVKGYEKFPKSYLKHFLKIKPKTTFNLQNLKDKTGKLASLPFASEIKPPEVLFSKDSTIVYLYLDKVKSNSFDGFLGFGTNEETNNLEFDGYLNLNLVNNLNYGESLRLNYKSDELDQQTFNINLDLPYLFNSPLGTELNLRIFKKDSSFTTATQKANLYYQVAANQRLYVGIESTQSSNLLDNTSSSVIDDFNTTFYKLRYRYQKNNTRQVIYPLKSSLQVDLGYGNRKQTNETQNQTTSSIQASQLFYLNNRNSFFTKIQGTVLFSDTYLSNEMFRFGGINNLRGFEENSIETNLYGVLNTEYRYLLSKNLYIHSIIDAAYVENEITETKQKLFGLGFGFGLITQAGLLKFNYANGKSDGQKIKLSESKIHLSLTAKF
jgi:hypothetical protein